MLKEDGYQEVQIPRLVQPNKENPFLEPGESPRIPETVARRGETVWIEQHPARDQDGGEKPYFDIVCKLPDTTKDFAFPVLKTVASAAGSYESRSPGAVVAVSKTNAAERASINVLRPATTLFEFGSHPGQGDWDMLMRVDDENELYVDGKPTGYRGTDKLDYLKRTLGEQGVTQMITHMQYPEMVDLADLLGINYPESIDVYDRFATKSGLNTALEDFSRRHQNATIGRFGTNFETRQEIIDEVKRLHSYGVGAYIKVDIDDTGNVNAGGEGQIAIPTTVSPEEINQYIDQVTANNGNAAGVVQMLVPEHYVMSISSGQEESGGYDIYEAHLQSQYGATADGATPLKDNVYSKELMESVWPQTVQFYQECGVVARQNMNFIVIPPAAHELAKKIYDNDRLSPVQPIDLNYRGMSGTMNVMYGYNEQTGKIVDLENFRSRGLRHIHPTYATDPTLMWIKAAELGLRVGEHGNFAIINSGNLWPYQDNYTKAQMVVSGTSVQPDLLLEILDTTLSEPPSETEYVKYAARYGISRIVLPDHGEYDEQAHTEMIENNMRRFLKTRDLEP